MSNIPPTLKSRIDEFLPNLRLGIDIGEWTGGLAVVEGNEILHAETYTDYHATTLEDRRKIRRGRRTRHAKKMRLARLRSWILRQKLPNGARLPDPYDLMRQKRFQHPPEELPSKRMDASQPFFDKTVYHYTSPWVYAVANGLRKDPDAFVLALTHIFQKRGYKYDQRDLSDLSANKLKEFLDSCCQLEKAGDLQLELGRLIEYFEENERTEEDTGKKSKKRTKASELREAFNRALKRPPEPRKAVPRQVKEAELKKLVAAFSASISLPDTLAENWEKQLRGLLNKVLREPRFENRVVSGCSWCGKQTPRKSRPGIRESAFRAAVMNIRKSRVLPLEESEKRDFVSLFQDPSFRAKGLAARKTTFERLLRKYDAQRNMASQLAELCGNDAPRGRTGLCQQHLKMQEQGGFRCNRHPGWICKLNGPQEGHIQMEFAGGLGPVERLARNPCREAHEERIVQRLEQILFNPDGSPKYGDLPALISIEFPKPNTAQALECPIPTCREKLALDLKTNQKIRGLKIGVSNKADPETIFPCPFCSANLFVQGKKRFFQGGSFQDRWVTLDISEVDVRKAKGGLKDKKDREYWKEVNGKCIYCEKGIEKGEREHIFPQSRGGPTLDYNFIAACTDCNRNKGHRTPFEWIARDSAGPCSWDVFQKRVNKLPISQRKKQILLCESDQYPDNPTALARATARKRAFIGRIKKMLVNHRVPADRISDNYEHGKIVIQAVEGWTTSRLRQSWRFTENGSPNFPEKRDWNLYNHAEDATLIAVSPPHTWRERIFVDKRVYDKHTKTWGPSELADRRLTETDRERYEVWAGCAPFSLAPEWAKASPIIQPLVTQRSRGARDWHSGFAKETFWQIFCPECEKVFQSKAIPPGLDELRCKDLRPDGCQRLVREAGNPFLRTLIRQYKPNWEQFTVCPRCGGVLGTLQQQDNSKRCKACKAKFNSRDIPGQRRIRAESQAQGPILVIRPSDGPPRVVNIEAPAMSICLVRRGSEDFVTFRLRPAIATLAGTNYVPYFREGNKIVLELWRDRMVALPEKIVPLPLRDKKTGLPLYYPEAVLPFLTDDVPGDGTVFFQFPSGRYRIKELSIRSENSEVWHEAVANGIAPNCKWIQPEHPHSFLTSEDVRRMEKEGKAKRGKFPERKIGKEDLREIARMRAV